MTTYQDNRFMHYGYMQPANYQCMPVQKLAQAYVPFQTLTNLYHPLEGLDKGTIFPELYQPYIAQRDIPAEEMEVL